MYKSSENHLKLNQRDIERLVEATDIIKAWAGNNLCEIILFGSYARGEQKKYSSIDILVILTQSQERFLQRKTALEKILNSSGAIPLIDTLVYTKDEIKDLIKKKESFIVSVLEEGCVMFNGKDDIEIQKINRLPHIIHSKYFDLLPSLKEVDE
jgi:predicted nucleotidyltransferase